MPGSKLAVKKFNADRTAFSAVSKILLRKQIPATHKAFIASFEAFRTLYGKEGMEWMNPAPAAKKAKTSGAGKS